MELTLEEWFAELDRHSNAIPLDVLDQAFPRVRIDWAAIQGFAQFSPERYRRNLMHAGPAYHALLLCWRSGQRSPIHDHRGSACAVRVLRGEATETIFEMTQEGRVFATRTHKLIEGFMCATLDLDIHQLGNDQPSGDHHAPHLFAAAAGDGAILARTPPSAGVRGRGISANGRRGHLSLGSVHRT